MWCHPPHKTEGDEEEGSHEGDEEEGSHEGHEGDEEDEDPEDEDFEDTADLALEAQTTELKFKLNKSISSLESSITSSAILEGFTNNEELSITDKLIKTINYQAKKLWHVSNAFRIPEGEKLAKKIKEKTFADYVMFQNSGAEATEAAIKVARRYFFSIAYQFFYLADC